MPGKLRFTPEIRAYLPWCCFNALFFIGRIVISIFPISSTDNRILLHLNSEGVLLRQLQSSLSGALKSVVSFSWAAAAWRCLMVAVGLASRKATVAFSSASTSSSSQNAQALRWGLQAELSPLQEWDFGCIMALIALVTCAAVCTSASYVARNSARGRDRDSSSRSSFLSSELALVAGSKLRTFWGRFPCLMKCSHFFVCYTAICLPGAAHDVSMCINLRRLLVNQTAEQPSPFGGLAGLSLSRVLARHLAAGSSLPAAFLVFAAGKLRVSRCLM